MYSLDYIYTKVQFKKIIKRLTEDPSAIWHDHLEREIREFQMVKEAYQSEVLNNLKNVKTSDDFLKDECEKQEKACKKDEIKKKLLDSYKKDYGTIVSNPEL